MSETPKLTVKTFKCRRCHVVGYMEVLGEVGFQDSYVEEDGPFVGMVHESSLYEHWQVCRCANCLQNNIIYSLFDENVAEFDVQPNIIYPASITFKASAAIDKVFRAAIEALPINPAAAVGQFRVILEMIWREHNPKIPVKPRLRAANGIIKQLVDEGILTGDYAEMADVLANIGNEAAHNDEDSISKADAEMARELCAVILEHVYHSRIKGLDLLRKLDTRFPRESGWRGGRYVEKKD